MTPAQLANLTVRHGGPIGRGGCTAIRSSTGERCKNAPVRGAERCRMHGGLLEVPGHQANARALFTGRLDPGYADARRQFYAFDRDIRQAVHHAQEKVGGAKPRRGRYHWPTLLAGAQALALDDEGLAFRRWLAAIRQT